MSIALAQVSDEEKSGFKAMYLLAAMGVRILPTPETSHPMWNDFLNAIKAAGLQATLLKATLLVNFSHGPFSSGANQLKLSEAGAHLMDIAPEGFLEEMNEHIARDRGEDAYDVTPIEWVQVCTKKITRVAWCEKMMQTTFGFFGSPNTRRSRGPILGT